MTLTADESQRIEFVTLAQMVSFRTGQTITLRMENAMKATVVTGRNRLEPSQMRWPDEAAGPWAVTVNWREDAGSVVCTGLP
jgi:hypothetical protein